MVFSKSNLSTFYHYKSLAMQVKFENGDSYGGNGLHIQPTAAHKHTGKYTNAYI